MLIEKREHFCHSANRQKARWNAENEPQGKIPGPLTSLRCRAAKIRAPDHRSPVFPVSLSQKKREQRLAVCGVVGKRGPGPSVVCIRPGSEIGHRPDCEGQSEEVPAGQGKTRPFDEFSKVIGARDPLEKAAARDRVAARPASFVQTCEDAIGADIDSGTDQKDENAQHEAGLRSHDSSSSGQMRARFGPFAQPFTPLKAIELSAMTIGMVLPGARVPSG